MNPQGTEDDACRSAGLEVNLAGQSCRGENEPVEATIQELGFDSLQEAEGGRVVIEDI